MVAAFLRYPSLIHAQSALQTPSPPTATSCCDQGVAPRELDFPYYNLRDGYQSTLRLVSDSPKPMDFTLAVRSSLGQMLTTSETIQPGAKRSFDLASLITQLGGDPTGAYAEGSVAVSRPHHLAAAIQPDNKKEASMKYIRPILPLTRRSRNQTGS